MSNTNTQDGVVEERLENFYSAVRTKNMIETPTIYNKWSNITNVPKQLKMDFSRMIGKPFFIKNITWATTDTQFSRLSTILVPTDLLSNSLINVPFTTSALYRSKLCFMVQVAGTSMHQGIVMVSSFPKTVNFAASKYDINRLMAAPHVFLSANDATPACLENPFYFPTKLSNTSYGASNFYLPAFNNNFSTLVFTVFNPLAVPTSATTSLTISVHAMFKDMEFYIPHNPVGYPTLETVFEAESLVSYKNLVTKGVDSVFTGFKTYTSDFLDIARQTFRNYTGLHNENNPTLMARMVTYHRNNNNNIDIPTYFEKLDPYADFTRLTKDYIFDTDIDEMNINFIIQKPYYLGTFVVNSTDVTGTLLWTRPISPVQEVLLDTANSYSTTAIEILARLSRFWRGTIKIHIQSASSDFHFTKFLISRNYVPTPNSLINAPTYADLFNLPAETIEFSGGGQVQTIELPYCSVFEATPIYCNDYRSNALLSGMYHIHLVQPLITNGSVALNAQYNVFISAGDDFQFYGYSTERSTIRLPTSTDFEAESTVIKEASNFDELQIKPVIGTVNDDSDFKPIVSVRDYIRRFYSVYSKVFSTASSINTFSISNLLGIQGITDLSTEVTPTETIFNMFHGFTGGAKFKVILNGVSNGRLYYIPPGMALAATGPSMNARASFPLTNNTDYTSAIVDSFTPLSATPRFPVNFVDMPNIISSSTLVVNYGSNDLENCVMELECSIPNMSPYRFVANSQNASTTLTPYILEASSDMGYLVVAYEQLQDLSTDIPPVLIPQPFSVEIFIAATDETRLGYQTILPVIGKALVTLTDPAGPTVITPYNPNNFVAVSSYPTLQAPQAYFTKST